MIILCDLAKIVGVRKNAEDLCIRVLPVLYFDTICLMNKRSVNKVSTKCGHTTLVVVQENIQS